MFRACQFVQKEGIETIIIIIKSQNAPVMSQRVLVPRYVPDVVPRYHGMWPMQMRQRSQMQSWALHQFVPLTIIPYDPKAHQTKIEEKDLHLQPIN